MKTVKSMSVGAGIAAAAIGAAIGSYFLTGDRKEKTEKVLKGWMLKAKGEVLEQLENAGDVTEEMYDDVVDKVAAKYSEMAGVAKDEVDDMAKELKKQWKMVDKSIKHVTDMIK